MSGVTPARVGMHGARSATGLCTMHDQTTGRNGNPTVDSLWWAPHLRILRWPVSPFFWGLYDAACTIRDSYILHHHVRIPAGESA